MERRDVGLRFGEGSGGSTSSGGGDVLGTCIDSGVRFQVKFTKAGQPAVVPCKADLEPFQRVMSDRIPLAV